MVDSRDKGARAEADIKKKLTELTGLNWQRVPSSGALDPKHGLKGDLYVPGEKNLWCVECKHYADDHLNSGILTHKSPQLFEWWDQCLRQADQVNREPLLVFKHDRSKLFCAYRLMPESVNLPFIFINRSDRYFYVSLLEEWIKAEVPDFIA